MLFCFLWFRSASAHTRWVYDIVHNAKEWLKSRILPSNVFSDMGLYYLGPVNGHDLEQLENAIRLLTGDSRMEEGMEKLDARFVALEYEILVVGFFVFGYFLYAFYKLFFVSCFFY